MALTNVGLTAIAATVLITADLAAQIRQPRNISGTEVNVLAPPTKRDVEDLSVPEYLKLESTFQSGPKCGLNALFVLLRLHGITVDYGDLEEQIEIGDQGCSLLQLSRTAHQHGVVAQCRQQVSPDSLKASNMPAILHINSVGVDGGSGESPQNHFCLVVNRYEDGSIFGIDTVRMTPATYGAASLARNMSGNALFVKDSPRIRSRRMKSIFRGVTFAAVIIWISVVAIKIRRGFLAYKN